MRGHGIPAVLIATALLGGISCSSNDDDPVPVTGSSPAAGATPGASAPTTAPSTSGTTPAPAPTGPADAEGDVSQAPPVGVNGFRVLGDRAFIADLRGDEVLAVDTSTGRITNRWPGLGGADDLDPGPDGSLWVTGYTAGELWRIRPDGTTTMVATLEVGLNPIVVTGDGLVVLARTEATAAGFEGDALWVLDSNAPEGTEPSRIEADLQGANGFGMDADGTILAARMVTDPTEAGLIRIDPATGEITELNTGFNFPTGVARRNDGTVAVVQWNPPAVLIADPLDLGTPPTKLADLSFNPDNIDVAGDGMIWVSWVAGPKLARIATDGTVSELIIGI